MTETKFISSMLGRLKRFAEAHNILILFVAHPTKPRYDKGGVALPPDLYSISGGANWYNKMDFGVIVHRNATGGPGDDGVEIRVQKVRYKAIGRPGNFMLDYDRRTGLYSDPIPLPSEIPPDQLAL